MSPVTIVALSLGLAFLTESMVEYIFGQAVDHLEFLEPFRWLLMYVALAVGVGLSFYYQLDLLAIISEQAGTPVGYALSGLVIGRGANYLHDFVSRYITPQR